MTTSMSPVENCKITFVTILDTAAEMCTWEKCNEYFSGLEEKAKWIIFDRSEEQVIEGAVPEQTQQDIDNYIIAVSKASNDKYVDYHKASMEDSTAKCFNIALDQISTPFICFTNGNVIYEKEVLRAINKAFVLYPDCLLFSINYKPQSTEASYTRAISAKNAKKNLESSPTIRIFLPSYFISRKLLTGMKFHDVCEEDTGTDFLIRLFQRDTHFVLLENIFCYYSKLLDRRPFHFYGCEDKSFYISSLKDIYLPILETYDLAAHNTPRWLQKTVYYQIYYKYYANLNLNNKYLLYKDETKEFYELTSKVLQYIDDDIIMDNTKPAQCHPPFSLRNMFIELKYQCDLSILDRSFYLENDTLYFKQCSCVYDMSKHQNLTVKAFNIRKDKLCIDMLFFTHLLHEYDPQAIYAEFNGERYDCITTGVYALDKVFGDSIKKSYTFLIELPMKTLIEHCGAISFWLELNGIKNQLALSFNRAPSKLNDACAHTYWELDNTHILEYKDKSLFITFVDKTQRQEREKIYLKETLANINSTVKNKKKRHYYIKDIKWLRKNYFRCKPFFSNQRIWIFFDKLYKAGDNGEYEFRYVYSHNKNIESYYVINEDSPDYPRLKKEFGKHILIYNSRKCKLYALLAETIIATHPDIIEFFGYDPKQTRFMRNLFNANLVCIAHGITIQKNADYQNRVYDNTMFYTTSSKYEVDHILHPIYGYSPDQVALTGLARFDGLKSNDKKQILITPTWRRNLVGSAKRNSTHRYTSRFKETAYYKIYNHLINDNRLIQTAKATGYKIIFLLHPSMSTQIDDYDRNDYVEIIPASGNMSYEKILTESSLMVTDYSGIHYDFAYMRKPVIYFQPKEIPMRFEEGGLKFETMGFGPVCTEYEDAIKLICEYMENQCKMPSKYLERADDFFAFSDYNNCQRIYEAVEQWIASKSKSV